MNKDKKAAPGAGKQPQTLYGRFESWAATNNTKIFYFLLISTIVLSLVSFNARISEAHDDALYLEGGWRYVHEFPNYFYTQNAPLYPMFLALLISIMGFKLIIFKLFSVAFNALGFVLFYKALKGRLPAVVFVPLMVFRAVNHLVIYFASMTFTESFYFFFQGLFLFYGVKLIDAIQENGVDIKGQLKLWLMLGLSMFLISTTKSVAIVIVPATLLFFMLQKNWKAMGATLGSYLVFKMGYEIITRLIWPAQSQFADQSKILMQKDPYDKSLGNEDLSGFIQRVIDNCNLSFSKRFYQLIGWRDENSTNPIGLITIITLALAIAGFVFLYKQKNRSMVLLALFLGAQALLSFIILAARWDQARITLVCMPATLTLVLYAFYHFTKKSGTGQVLYLGLAGLLVGSLWISVLKRSVANIPIVEKNMKGDKYYGYTPDWQNFLKCSEWCADSLGKDALVASRKAPMSFVYGRGKKFFPIYSVVKKDSTTNQSNPDSALAYFKHNGVTHVMLGTLRLDPKDPTAGFINTVHHIMAPIAQKYPEKIQLIHTEGVTEQTYVYKLIY